MASESVQLMVQKKNRFKINFAFSSKPFRIQLNWTSNWMNLRDADTGKILWELKEDVSRSDKEFEGKFCWNFPVTRFIIDELRERTASLFELHDDFKAYLPLPFSSSA